MWREVNRDVKLLNLPLNQNEILDDDSVGVGDSIECFEGRKKVKSGILVDLGGGGDALDSLNFNSGSP